MNVSLTPQLEKIVQKKVKSGLYHSASEVIRAGLRLLEEREQLRDLRLQELRRDLAQAQRQADAGETTPLRIADLKKKARSRKRAGA